MGQKSRKAWDLTRRQHGVVARRQLLDAGFNSDEIQYRVERRRLHPLYMGVYAVGRREVARHGRWMAAVLASGEDAVLSHEAAGALLGIRGSMRIEVTVPTGRTRDGITTHRRKLRPGDITTRDRIPVTTTAATLIDLATRLGDAALERAINQADQLDLIDPEVLRVEAGNVGRRPGARRLRALLDRYTFSFTRSELEQALIPIALRAGLPMPLTCEVVNGHEVDFYWPPPIGLVVEADSLRYHRTAQIQTQDLVRDQAHAVSNLKWLRFSHGQIKYQPTYVENTLARLASLHGWCVLS